MISQTRLEICVRYSAPVSDCRRILRVLPLRRAGQTVLSERWSAFPPAASMQESPDAAGNRRLLLRHARIESEFRFGLECEVETSGAPCGEAPDFVSAKMPSRAVVFAPEFQLVAREAREMAPLERAAHFNRVCFLRLEYDAKVCAAPLQSAQIWQRKSGNCADFAHVLLSLCRCSGLAARYVAGFNAAQGQMHAWAEIWAEGCWHALDPTLGRAISGGSVAVAVGRDFYDCAPHQGSYRGAGEASISLFCVTTTKK